MSIIKAKNVHFDYIQYDEEGENPTITHAVKGVDMTVEEGQFIAVLGRNGCGKSTFAKHINALLIPTDGVLYVREMDTKEDKYIWDIRQTAGMVFQNPDNQIIASVVEEDVAFGPENLGVPTDEIWQGVEDALKVTGMTAYREFSPNKLSGGQKQRIAIAGVMAMKPKCIVLDEPTAMLDPVGRKDVLNALYELNEKQNVTIVLITHYMEEVIKADKIFVMNDGCVEMSGAPREIFLQVDRLRELGLDVPQVTLLAHELKKEGLDINEPVLTIEEMVDAVCRLS